MISFKPTMQALHKAFGSSLPDLELAASDRWIVSPAITRQIAAATFLPNQFDRLRGVAFGSVAEVVRSLRDTFDTHEPETLGFRLHGADLVDGVVYADRSVRNLRQRRRRLPIYVKPTEITNGALFESWVGNRWFGNWLSDDCLTYALAEQYGVPVTASRRDGGHARSYEKLLDLRPEYVASTRFDELIFFRDASHNAGKAARADCARRKLMAGRPPARFHPGVFLLRGNTGDERVLSNERVIADALARRRGFNVIDPESSSVDQIIDACSGARVVAGVEGSHLVHGLMVMPPGATLFVIQPPDRVVSVLKIITDREGQGFAFVIGDGSSREFEASIDDIDRTLDMVDG